MRVKGATSHAMSPSNGDLNGHAGLLGEKTPLSPTIRDRFIVVLRYLADLLRPSILTPSRGPRKALHATAYLDGLRGFAAFMVYWQHHQVWARVGLDANDIFENAWGYEDRWYFACLPFIRTFFTGGHFSVAVFFVISGFVLSNKPLALIHAGDQGKLMENLSSAMFRRWLRLYIPAVGTTFLYMTSWHAFGIMTAWPDHQKDYRAELANWWTEIRVFGWLFRGGNKLWLSYNFHLWSIPVEFRGSVIIYSTLMAV
jgi:peptidoglycan/LPS O-acetylase OafA/YrhL